MRHGHCVAVIIPALNEERAIGRVIADVPAWVDRIIVGDNGSTDKTAEVARAAGATVIAEPQPGYGAACLKALTLIGDAEVVVFLDGDYSDHPDEMQLLVDPIVHGHADMVIGSRVLGQREAGSLTPQQRFGNWLATRLIRLIWGVNYTDLGPFRAIRATSLKALEMCDQNYGWTVEMQIKAAIHGLKSTEVAVSYRRRIGVSKVSGTIKGTVLAGYKILSMIGWYGLFSRQAASPRE